ncbi:MAG: hypothetical protein ACO4AU_06800 [bacterium]|jgi:hypothetical protein
MEWFAGEIGIIDLILGGFLAAAFGYAGGMVSADVLYGKEIGGDVARFLGGAFGPVAAVPGIGLLLFLGLFI